MAEIVPMPPPVAPDITGIAQISGSGPTTLSPGKYYFAYALNHRISQWPKFVLSDLGPAIEVIASESFNAVDMYDHPFPPQSGAQSFVTLYMTDQYPDKAAPVHWRAVNTIALGNAPTLLTVGLLATSGVYDGPTLNDILQTNNAINNIIHTEGRSTGATGKIQIQPVGTAVRTLSEASPVTTSSLWLWGLVVIALILSALVLKR